MKTNEIQNQINDIGGDNPIRLSGQPSSLIEPENPTIKQEKGAINWEPWEHDYRVKLRIELTAADKLEIKSTVPAFFRLLLEIGREVKSDESAE